MQGRQTAQNHLIQKTFMMINTSDYHDGGGKKEHEDGCEHNLKGSHGSGIHFVDEGELIDKWYYNGEFNIISGKISIFVINNGNNNDLISFFS